MRLLGSTDIVDYQNIDGFTDGIGSAMGYCLVGAVDVKNAEPLEREQLTARGRNCWRASTGIAGSARF